MVTDAVRRRLDHRLVGRVLFILARHGRMGEEQVFGAIKADAGRAGANRHLGVGGVADVGEQLHFDAVAGDPLS